MYNEKFYLTPQEILNYDFKIDARGYRPQEVDKLLDMVIRDYTEYNNVIKSLEAKNKNLMDDNFTLKTEIRRLQDELTSIDSEPKEKNVTNIDLLKRISQLEKYVYDNRQ